MVRSTNSISWFVGGRNRKKVRREKGETSSVGESGLRGLDFIEVVIREGAKYELKPNEIMNMHLWEFNNYIMGYKGRLQREQENIVRLAYTTAGFVNSKKKPKPLQVYLEKIAKSFNHKPDNTKVDVEKAKNIERTIEELKKAKGVEQM